MHRLIYDRSMDHSLGQFSSASCIMYDHDTPLPGHTDRGDEGASALPREMMGRQLIRKSSNTSSARLLYIHHTWYIMVYMIGTFTAHLDYIQKATCSCGMPICGRSNPSSFRATLTLGGRPPISTHQEIKDRAASSNDSLRYLSPSRPTFANRKPWAMHIYE